MSSWLEAKQMTHVAALLFGSAAMLWCWKRFAGRACSHRGQGVHRDIESPTERITAVEGSYFLVSVSRRDDRWLGMALRGTLVVQVFDTGLIPDWNTQHLSQEVRVGDHIFCLVLDDGVKVRGIRAILAELRKTGPLTIVVRRGHNESVVEPPTPETTDHLMKDHWLPEFRRVDATCTEHELCPICLEDFDGDSELVQLPCSHVFHYGCVDHHFKQCVLASEARCPMCRHSSFVGRPSPFFLSPKHADTS